MNCYIQLSLFYTFIIIGFIELEYKVFLFINQRALVIELLLFLILRETPLPLLPVELRLFLSEPLSDLYTGFAWAGPPVLLKLLLVLLLFILI